MTEAAITPDLPADVPTVEAVRKAWGKLLAARERLFRAESEALRTKSMLETRRAAKIREGVEGKNQAERDAHLDALCGPELQAWRQAEADARDYRHEYDVAAMEAQSLRWQVRAVLAARGEGRG